MARDRKESPSSRALAALIKDVGYAEISDQTKIHRTQLWRYSTGLGKPDVEQAAKLHRVSKGRVAADGWESDAVASRRKGKTIRKRTGTDGGR